MIERKLKINSELEDSMFLFGKNFIYLPCLQVLYPVA